VLEALVQPPKDVEDEDPVFNGCADGTVPREQYRQLGGTVAPVLSARLGVL
jgi:hypothetical protein